MTLRKHRRYVHIVSHGPQCLDGVTAAVVVACFHPECDVEPVFCSNTSVNRTLRELECGPPDAEHEVWITDISWTDPQVDVHLTGLQKRGVALHWVDHHRTALERFQSRAIHVPFSSAVIDESFAASRLAYEYLRQRRPLAAEPPGLAQLVAMADDNDRWLHRIADSHALALAVNALNSTAAYDELLLFAQTGQWSDRLRSAYELARQEASRSIALASRTRAEWRLEDLGITLVAAVCNGYPSEVAEEWNREAERCVFAFFDLRSQTVSFRRSPDCEVDLSQLAKRFGGGGHPAASGCDIPDVLQELSESVAKVVAPALLERGR